MLVREVMSNAPQYCSPEHSLHEIAEKMRNEDYGFMPIGENDRLVGIVTDRDIACRAVAEGKDPGKTHARDVMSPNVWYCYEDQPIEEAAKSMESQQVHRLIVLNRDKRMTGILALCDIANKTRDEKLCGEVVEGISENH